MATILPTVYRHAAGQFKIARSTRENAELGYLADMMIGQEISRVSGILAGCDLTDQVAQKILALLSQQAALLPQKERIRGEGPSVDSFAEMIRIAEESAESLDASRMKSILDSYRKENVYPRNGGEIGHLIECKGKLKTLTSLFEVCCDIETLYNPPPVLDEKGDLATPMKPNRGQLGRLRERLKEVDRGQPYPALATARRQLEIMERGLPPNVDLFADLKVEDEKEAVPCRTVELPSKMQPSSHVPRWTLVAGGATAALALALLYRAYR